MLVDDVDGGDDDGTTPMEVDKDYSCDDDGERGCIQMMKMVEMMMGKVARNDACMEVDAQDGGDDDGDAAM
jgi:hypothetical protein